MFALRRHLRADALRGIPHLAAAFTIMGLLCIGFYGTEAFILLLLTALRAPATANLPGWAWA